MLSSQPAKNCRAYRERQAARERAVEENWRNLAAATIGRVHTPRSLSNVLSPEDGTSLAFLAMHHNRDRSRAYQWRSGVNAIHDAVREIRGRTGAKSCTVPVSDLENRGFNDGQGFAAKANGRVNINTLITLLPDSRWQVVIEGIFVDEQAPEDIAADLGVTVGRVSQIKTEALAFLKTIITEDGTLKEGEEV